MGTEILIVDDEQIVREGLVALFNSNSSRYEVVGQASNGLEAVEMTRELRPRLVIMDISMPKMDGIEATRNISLQVPNTSVIMWTRYGGVDIMSKSFDAGARGYTTKKLSFGDLENAMGYVLNGYVYAPGTYGAWRNSLKDSKKVRMGLPAFSQTDEYLSPRELEVLKLIVTGNMNKDVASQLGLSIKTVEKHRQSIMDKLNIHEVAGLTKYSLAKGIISAQMPLEQSA